MANLDKRVQDLERKLTPEEPVTIRIVHYGERVDDGTPHIQLGWGDVPILKVQPGYLERLCTVGGDDART